MVKLQAIVAGLFCLIKTINSEAYSGTCIQPTVADAQAGNELSIQFVFDPTGLTGITGLETYDASEDPNFATTFTDAACTTNTLNADGNYVLYVNVDTDGALPCGIQQQINTNQYKFAVSPVGLVTVYVFTCDVTSFDVVREVTASNFDGGHVDATTQVVFTGSDVDFSMLLPSDAVLPQPPGPIPQVDLATPVKLRLEFTTASAISSLHVVTLIMGNNANFNDKVQTIISAGCNNNVAGTTSNSVGLFTRVGTTTPVILDTNVFRAYRFAEGNAAYADVYFRVTFTPCFAPDKCNVCGARKKRSDEEIGMLEHRDLHVRVVSPQNADGKGRTECKTVVTYWAPHALLLLTIITEGAVVAFILRKKSQLYV